MLKRLLIVGLTAVFATSAFAATPGSKPKRERKAKNAKATTAPKVDASFKGEEWQAKLAERQTAMSEEMKAQVEKVKADLADLKANGAALEADLLALVAGEEKPSQESVAKLSTDLQAVLADKTLAEDVQMRLAQNIEYIFNTDFTSAEPAELQSAYFDVNTILKDAEVKGADAKKVPADLRGISKQLYGKGNGKGAETRPAAEADAETQPAAEAAE